MIPNKEGVVFRIRHICERFGYDDDIEPYSAPRLKDLWELVMLIDPEINPEAVAHCRWAVDNSDFHNQAVSSIEQFLIDQVRKLP
jgi:hypothetical protein